MIGWNLCIPCIWIHIKNVQTVRKLSNFIKIIMPAFKWYLGLIREVSFQFVFSSSWAHKRPILEKIISDISFNGMSCTNLCYHSTYSNPTYQYFILLSWNTLLAAIFTYLHFISVSTTASYHVYVESNTY